MVSRDHGRSVNGIARPLVIVTQTALFKIRRRKLVRFIFSFEYERSLAVN